MNKPFRENYRRTVLDNGLRVVSEEIPEARSISFGIFIEVGSRDEPDEFAGTAHFLEHMAFKGTRHRSPRAISFAVERSGGSLNAFTGKEFTGFHATVLASQWKTAIDVLTDIVSNSTFPERELQKEKGIVADELRSVLETPDDLVFELWQEELFPAHPLGRSILGAQNTIERIDRERLLAFVAAHYHPQRIVCAAAGALNHDQLCGAIAKRMTQKNDSPPPPRSMPPLGAPRTGLRVERHPSENAHLVAGNRAYAYCDPRKVPLFVINNILGGGMSSRLFQEIRERRGIAYSVYSFVDNYRDSGLFGIYLAADRAKLGTARDIALEQLHKIAVVPLRARELAQAKTQLKGGIILALEATPSRMSRITRMELYGEDYLSIDDLARRIDNVSTDDILATAAELWSDMKLVEVQLIPEDSGSRKPTSK